MESTQASRATRRPGLLRTPNAPKDQSHEVSMHVLPSQLTPTYDVDFGWLVN